MLRTLIGIQSLLHVYDGFILCMEKRVGEGDGPVV